MIIESAFLKLPELLTSNFDHRDTFEATVVHQLGVAVLMELNSRNIPMPFEHVQPEKPYLLGNGWRSDLHIVLKGVIRPNGRMGLYGSRERNWIEVKAFLTSTRSESSVARTANAGRIIRDILRLCLLPEELLGTSRDNARYLVTVFSNVPSKSVAYRRFDRAERLWVKDLLTEGTKHIEIDLTKEPESLRKAVGLGFSQPVDLKLELTIHTICFEPLGPEMNPVFWGFLNRIQSFRISTSSYDIEYHDIVNSAWTQDHDTQMSGLRRTLLPLLGHSLDETLPEVT